MTRDGSVPRNFVPHRKDVSLRMKVLPHAYLPQVQNGHNANIEWKDGVPLLVAWYGRNARSSGRDGVGLQPLRFRVSLDVRRTGICR